MRLTASCRARLSPPSGDGFLGELHREASPLAQSPIVLGPIRHPVPLLRSMVTASGIVFEWHGRNLWSEVE